MKKIITINNTELTLVPTEVSNDIYIVKKDRTIIGWVGDVWEMIMHDFINEFSVPSYDVYVFKSALGSFEVYEERFRVTLEKALFITENYVNRMSVGRY